MSMGVESVECTDVLVYLEMHAKVTLIQNYRQAYIYIVHSSRRFICTFYCFRSVASNSTSPDESMKSELSDDSDSLKNELSSADDVSLVPLKVK